MKLFQLYPKNDFEGPDPWEPWYDKAFGFIVRAESEEQAREMANQMGGDEIAPVGKGKKKTAGNPWLDPKYTECVELLPEGKAGVIIRDFMSA